ncbi:hypothetical protein OPQ81_007392 [Rhizoctonia solani]|nr:hypothetical protein OPQ81_007392 [Rhizoctonia solani]
MVYLPFFDSLSSLTGKVMCEDSLSGLAAQYLKALCHPKAPLDSPTVLVTITPATQPTVAFWQELPRR